MASDARGNGEAVMAEPAAGGRILITFGGAHGADPIVNLSGVTPGQVMAAAWFLDQFARELRAQPPGGAGGLVVPQVIPRPVRK